MRSLRRAAPALRASRRIAEFAILRHNPANPPSTVSRHRCFRAAGKRRHRAHASPEHPSLHPLSNPGPSSRCMAIALSATIVPIFPLRGIILCASAPLRELSSSFCAFSCIPADSAVTYCCPCSAGGQRGGGMRMTSASAAFHPASPPSRQLFN